MGIYVIKMMKITLKNVKINIKNGGIPRTSWNFGFFSDFFKKAY